MKRDYAAEWVGYYFGLQFALNIKPEHRADEETYRHILEQQLLKVQTNVDKSVIESWDRRAK